MIILACEYFGLGVMRSRLVNYCFSDPGFHHVPIFLDTMIQLYGFHHHYVQCLKRFFFVIFLFSIKRYIQAAIVTVFWLDTTRACGHLPSNHIFFLWWWFCSHMSWWCLEHQRHGSYDPGRCSAPQSPLTPSNWSALCRGHGSPVMSWILLKANNAQQSNGGCAGFNVRFKSYLVLIFNFNSTNE